MKIKKSLALFVVLFCMVCSSCSGNFLLRILNSSSPLPYRERLKNDWGIALPDSAKQIFGCENLGMSDGISYYVYDINKEELKQNYTEADTEKISGEIEDLCRLITDYDETYAVNWSHNLDVCIISKNEMPKKNSVEEISYYDNLYLVYDNDLQRLYVIDSQI